MKDSTGKKQIRKRGKRYGGTSVDSSYINRASDSNHKVRI